MNSLQLVTIRAPPKKNGGFEPQLGALQCDTRRHSQVHPLTNPWASHSQKHLPRQIMTSPRLAPLRSSAWPSAPGEKRTGAAGDTPTLKAIARTIHLCRVSESVKDAAT